MYYYSEWTIGSYLFKDHDDNTLEELTIKDEDYSALLYTCFQYCSVFSLVFHDQKMLAEWKMRALFSDLIKENRRWDGKPICYFRYTRKSLQFLEDTVHDLFDWIWTEGRSNPEDLTFYRADQSVFFRSETHEGICFLHPRAAIENVQQIVRVRGWQENAGQGEHSRLIESQEKNEKK